MGEQKINSKDVSLHVKNIFLEPNGFMNNASITDNP
jgi:hypothetical protein